MKELINKVTITGTLVKNTLEEFTTKKGVEAIGGSLVLRTADNSEHEIKFFNNKYKKDENKQFTSEEAYFYKAYMEAKENLKDLENCHEGEIADVISINDGTITINDYKGKDGEVKSYNEISGKFINKVENKDLETTPKIAKFEVEGIVESITDELVKSVPTGNLVVKLNAIKQRADGFGKDAKYEADSLIPIRLIVDKSMAAMFRQAGYYDGCYAKFVGVLINTTEIQEVVEKQAFGADNVSTVKTTVKKYEIKSGSAPSTFFEHELTQDVIDALISKRKTALAEVKAGIASSNDDKPPFETAPSKPAPQTTYNPFAQQ
jgi:hypothetical protein